jgi:hypothetical protein
LRPRWQKASTRLRQPRKSKRALTAARNASADVAYDNVRNGAGQVDVVGTLNHIDNIIGTGPGQAPTDA